MGEVKLAEIDLSQGSNLTIQRDRVDTLFYVRSGSVIVRTDTRFTRPAITRFFKGPTLLGIDSHTPISQPYEIKALNGTQVQLYQAQSSDNPTERFIMAHNNDARYLSLLVDALYLGGAVNRFKGVLDLLTEHGKHPTPAITEQDIADLAGTTRERVTDFKFPFLAARQILLNPTSRRFTITKKGLEDEFAIALSGFYDGGSLHPYKEHMDTNYKLTKLIQLLQNQVSMERVAILFDIMTSGGEFETSKQTGESLAELAGLSRAIVSQVIKKFRARGLIERSKMSYKMTPLGRKELPKIVDGHYLNSQG